MKKTKTMVHITAIVLLSLAVLLINSAGLSPADQIQPSDLPAAPKAAAEILAAPAGNDSIRTSGQAQIQAPAEQDPISEEAPADVPDTNSAGPAALAPDIEAFLNRNPTLYVFDAASFNGVFNADLLGTASLVEFETEDGPAKAVHIPTMIAFAKDYFGMDITVDDFDQSEYWNIEGDHMFLLGRGYDIATRTVTGVQYLGDDCYLADCSIEFLFHDGGSSYSTGACVVRYNPQSAYGFTLISSTIN